MLRKIIFGSSFFCMQLWLGASLFLSFILAPILFTKFRVETAADVMGAAFPAYGILHLVCASLVVAGLLLAWKNRARLGKKTYFAALVCGILAIAFAAAQTFYLFPQSRALRAVVVKAREAGNIESAINEAAEMMSLHRYSVNINNLTILIILFLGWFYYRVAREWDKK